MLRSLAVHRASLDPVGRWLSKVDLAVFAVPALLALPAVAQITTRVSVDSAGVQGDNDSHGPSVSADGRFVAFWGWAANLVAGDSNTGADVFLRDRQLGTTELVSVDSGGVQGNLASVHASISADGRYVAFMSNATNLVAGDTNGREDVFVRDRQLGTTERVSIATGGGEGDGDSGSSGVSLSADGRFVAFDSYASNLVLGDTNGGPDVFVHDRQSGATERVSVDSSGAQGNAGSGFVTVSISADGRYVAFVSDSTNLVPGDTNGFRDVFVHDRQSGATERVSVDSSGVQGNSSSGLVSGVSISGDGRYVAFVSDATNFVPGDTNGDWDVFVHDRQSGATERVSVDSSGAQGDAGSGYDGISISADGRYVAFASTATNLVPGDTNGDWDVFVHDRQSGRTERVSVATGGAQGSGRSFYPSISVDGRYVSFESYDPSLVPADTNNASDVFMVDRACLGSVATYCTAKVNSLGCLPSIGSIGVPSQSGPDNFYVTASNVRNNKLGMMLWSLAPDSHPFFGGTLCLHSPIKRTPGQNSGGSPAGDDCTGTYAYHFTQAYMLQQLLAADTTVYAQFWSRDPGFAPPSNIGLTDGLRFTICP
jgi:Tol biopolymer transport system component